LLRTGYSAAAGACQSHRHYRLNRSGSALGPSFRWSVFRQEDGVASRRSGAGSRFAGPARNGSEAPHRRRLGVRTARGETRRHERPSIKADEALIKVKSCVLCGSDVHQWDGRRFTPLPYISGTDRCTRRRKSGPKRRPWRRRRVTGPAAKTGRSASKSQSGGGPAIGSRRPPVMGGGCELATALRRAARSGQRPARTPAPGARGGVWCGRLSASRARWPWVPMRWWRPTCPYPAKRPSPSGVERDRPRPAPAGSAGRRFDIVYDCVDGGRSPDGDHARRGAGLVRPLGCCFIHRAQLPTGVGSTPPACQSGHRDHRRHHRDHGTLPRDHGDLFQWSPTARSRRRLRDHRFPIGGDPQALEWAAVASAGRLKVGITVVADA